MGKLAAYLRSKHLYTYSRFNLFFIAPPLVITEEELKYGLDIVDEALTPWTRRSEPEGGVFHTLRHSCER